MVLGSGCGIVIEASVVGEVLGWGMYEAKRTWLYALNNKRK